MHADNSSLLRCMLGGAIVCAALIFSGCASPADPAAMTASPTTAVTKHPESVSVSVSGGSETSSMGASQISNADFAAAIKASVTQSGLFAKLAEADQSDYRISAQIVRMDQPTFGFSMTVTLEINWRLTKRGDEKVIWQKAVVSTFTATTSNSMAGPTRLRLANEGAARNNIQDAIGQIGALTLP